MKRKFWLGGGAVLLLVLVLAWIYAGGGQEVQVLTAEKGSIAKILNETGYVEAGDDYEMQAQQSGKITEIALKPGDKVTRGQLVLSMESPELQVEIKQSESQLAMTQGELSTARQSLSTLQIDRENAEKTLARQEQLHSSGAISEAEYEKAESAARNLREQLAQQQSYLQSLQSKVQALEGMAAQLNAKEAALQVLSPIDGIILDLPLKAGAYVSPGSLLAQVGAAGGMEVKVEILSDDIKDIALGQKAFITAPVLGVQTLEGAVKEIRPRAFAKISALGVEQRRVPVFIALNKSENLQPGYEVEVGIETARKDKVLVLPREAVKNTGNGSYEVMKVQNGKIVHTAIKLGLKNEEQVEVLSGLQEGDRIVRDASTDIKEGSRIKAQAK
ncbi:MAG: efflux RND transporter periplasmic adaptor subunit [Syntrophomonas sp.]